MLVGIDVSGNSNGVINWDQVVTSNLVNFVIAKASEGITFQDPQFKTNWKTIKEKGWLRGSYHFARNNDPVAEADHFINTLGEIDPADMLVLDIETTKLKGSAFTDWVLAWCSEVQTKTNHIPWIYTGGPFFSTAAGVIDTDTLIKLSQYPLWLAAYSNTPEKYIPAPWKEKGLSLHQITGDVAPAGMNVFHCPGIHGNVDKNLWSGTLEELKAFALSLYQAPEPCLSSEDVATEIDGSQLESTLS